MQNFSKGFFRVQRADGRADIYANHVVRSAMSYPDDSAGRVTVVDVGNSYTKVWVAGDYLDVLAQHLGAHLYEHRETRYLRREPLVIDRVHNHDIRGKTLCSVSFAGFDDMLTFDSEDATEQFERAQRFLKRRVYPDEVPLF